MTILKTLLFLAGISQVILVIGSLAIPKLLNWKHELSKVSPLIKQMFWTYAGYILVTNLSFGILSMLSPESLMDSSTLAIAVSLFIGTYWGARIAIQFFYFDRKGAPKGTIYFLGEIGLVSMFIFYTAVYLYAFYFNLINRH